MCKYEKAADVCLLGITLYFCLSVLLPFSDELRTPYSPKKALQHIISGLFDYPSPIWDHSSDAARDLIDHMLIVDLKSRFFLEDCEMYPWVRRAHKNLDIYGSDRVLLATSRDDIARQRKLLVAKDPIDKEKLLTKATAESVSEQTVSRLQEKGQTPPDSREPTKQLEFESSWSMGIDAGTVMSIGNALLPHDNSFSTSIVQSADPEPPFHFFEAKDSPKQIVDTD